MRRAADALDKVLRGERIRHAWFKFPRLAEAARRFEGQRVDGVEARGKALIVCFEDGSAVYTHNQLYGKWLVGPTGQRPDTTRDLRFALETDRHAALLYSASDIELWRTDELGQHPYISRLGVELLARGTTVDAVLAQVEDPRFARSRLRTQVWPALQAAFADAEQGLAVAWLLSVASLTVSTSCEVIALLRQSPLRFPILIPRSFCLSQLCSTTECSNWRARACFDCRSVVGEELLSAEVSAKHA